MKEFFTAFRFLKTTSQEDTLFLLSNTEDYSFRYDCHLKHSRFIYFPMEKYYFLVRIENSYELVIMHVEQYFFIFFLFF